MEKERLLILVVDPDPEDHHLIRQSLRRSKVPASLQIVSSTQKALEEIKTGSFDLILADHVLPEANAFQLLIELRRQGRDLPVIVLSRDGEARIVREAFQRGADDYLLKEELEAISLFDVIGNVIEKRRERRELEERQNRLRELAERDGLTDLCNHRHFLEELEREFSRSRRYDRPLSLLMIDLDGFKAINDTCGHPQGDTVLKKTAVLIQKTIRQTDLAARYGGDEFAVLLAESDLSAARTLAERLVREIRRNPFLFNQKIFPLSASIGVASFHPGLESAGALLREADQALYEAKRNGRNCAVTAHPTLFSSSQNENVALRP